MVCVIAAVSENGVIGKEGKIPWNIPADMKRFRELTTGCAVVMGRKTYESIGRPLPNRLNIVVSSTAEFLEEEPVLVPSFEKAVETAESKGYHTVYACGGTEIYREALKSAEVIYLTKVHKIVSGDAFFPSFNESLFEKSEEKSFSDTENYSFITYRRLK